MHEHRNSLPITSYANPCAPNISKSVVSSRIKSPRGRQNVIDDFSNNTLNQFLGSDYNTAQLHSGERPNANNMFGSMAEPH
jgi:hypothetical protein